MSATSAPWWHPTGVIERGTATWHRVERQLARQPMARLTTAAPRTARWVSESLRARAEEPLPGMPRTRLTPALIGHVAMDESIMAMAVGPNRYPTRALYERVGAELALARERLGAAGYLDDPASYHRAPPAPEAVAHSRGWALGMPYERLWWPSGYAPPVELPGWERWRSYEANRTASAWLLRHRGAPRPWVVCIHGFGTGSAFMDMITFRARHLHDDLGLNVAAIVLPAHGARRLSRFSGEDFLGYDLMNSLHGLAQAVWDLRSLLAWVRTQEPTAVGVFGVSLGGYLTALLAALEPELDLTLAGIPVSDMVELFRYHSPRHVHLRAIEHHILDRTAEDVHRVVSPLAMPPLAPRDSRAVFAGLGDRLAPPEQARALWEHWDRPRTCWFPGNHVGYLWAERPWRFVDEVLADRLPATALAATHADPIPHGV